jgi:2-polyprenyl-3-methyl-5-hydroxy-6-metoxy-1,4-benzoquinol methylase
MPSEGGTMQSDFYESRLTNQYDNMVIDVEQLYRDFPLNSLPKLRYRTARLARYYHTRYLPRRFRIALMRFLRTVLLDLTWFNEFKVYWETVLQGRTLWGVQDLYFLRNWYRVKYQNIRIPDVVDASAHVQAWQQPEVMHFLLHMVYREGIDQNIEHQFEILSRIHHLGRKPTSMLEFGCATATLTRFYIDLYDRQRTTQFYISDLESLAFHYAMCRFSAYSNVKAIPLRPEQDLLLQLDAKVDVIFCTTVFEHLNQPLRTLEIFLDRLNPGGILIFDYIKSDTKGLGLDTRQGLEERKQVLDVLSQHFEIVEGKIDYDASMGLTVARKR